MSSHLVSSFIITRSCLSSFLMPFTILYRVIRSPLPPIMQSWQCVCVWYVYSQVMVMRKEHSCGGHASPEGGVCRLKVLQCRPSLAVVWRKLNCHIVPRCLTLLAAATCLPWSNLKIEYQIPEKIKQVIPYLSLSCTDSRLHCYITHSSLKII